MTRYACADCERRFSTSANLRRHQRRNHGLLISVVCHKCCATVPGSFAHHIRTPHCDHCSFSAPNWRILDLHHDAYHWRLPRTKRPERGAHRRSPEGLTNLHTSYGTCLDPQSLQTLELSLILQQLLELQMEVTAEEITAACDTPDNLEQPSLPLERETPSNADAPRHHESRRVLFYTTKT